MTFTTKDEFFGNMLKGTMSDIRLPSNSTSFFLVFLFLPVWTEVKAVASQLFPLFLVLLS